MCEKEREKKGQIERQSERERDLLADNRCRASERESERARERKSERTRERGVYRMQLMQRKRETEREREPPCSKWCRARAGFTTPQLSAEREKQ